MPPLHENAHTTALLNDVRNFGLEAVEHLNPNQTHALTMDQPILAIAKEIQWLWPGSFGKDKCVIMNGSRRPGAITAAGTFCSTYCIAWCCRIFCEGIYLAMIRHGHQVTAAALHILQQSVFLSYVEFEPGHAVSSEQ